MFRFQLVVVSLLFPNILTAKYDNDTKFDPHPFKMDSLRSLMAVTVNRKCADYLLNQMNDIIIDKIAAFNYDRYEKLSYVFTNISIPNFQPPNYTLILNETSNLIQFTAFFPKTEVQAYYQSGWFCSGWSNATIMSIEIQLSIAPENHKGSFWYSIPKCRAKIPFGSITGKGCSAFSSGLKMARPWIEDNICQLLTGYGSASGMCPNDNMPCVNRTSTIFDYLKFNGSLSEHPVVKQAHAVILLGGGFSYKNWVPKFLYGQWSLNETDVDHSYMVNIFVSERSINNLLSVVYELDLININETVSYDHLPIPVSALVMFACGGCAMKVQGKLYDQPIVSINNGKAQMVMSGWLRITLRIFDETVQIALVQVKLTAEISAKIVRTRKNGESLHLSGEIREEQLEFLNVGIPKFASVFSPTLVDDSEVLLARIVTKYLSNKLHHKFQKGCYLPLFPSICSAHLTESRIRIGSNAIIIDSNVFYDLRKMINSILANNTMFQ